MHRAMSRVLDTWATVLCTRIWVYSSGNICQCPLSCAHVLIHVPTYLSHSDAWHELMCCWKPGCLPVVIWDYTLWRTLKTRTVYHSRSHSLPARLFVLPSAQKNNAKEKKSEGKQCQEYDNTLSLGCNSCHTETILKTQMRLQCCSEWHLASSC